MSVSGAELQKAPPSQHARLQLQRSVSEAPTVYKPPRAQHHTQIHRRDKDEKAERFVPASLLPSATFDGIRSEGMTPNGSYSGSRRTSVFTAADDNPGMAGRQRERRVLKEGELKAEKDKSALRAAELRKSLVELNTVSNSTTSRLDNTYYSVLEKLSALKSTIVSLKELAALTRKLNDDFVNESVEVVRDIEIQLDGFEDFQGQERKIGDLEHRIDRGREKVHVLGDRVELLRQKIERWERVEGEWQQRTRKRMNMLWAVIATALFILLGLVAFQYTPARTHGPGTLHGLNISNIAVNISEIENILSSETRSLKRSAFNALEELQRAPQEELEDDPRLRAFDEL